MTYRLRSKAFQNERLQKAANDHAYHLLRDSTGYHVFIIQMFLVMCGVYKGLLQKLGKDYGDVANEFGSETAGLRYGAVTEELVRIYKEVREIKNGAGQIDGIVGVLTMRAMDSHQQQLEANGTEFGDRQQGASLAPQNMKTKVLVGIHRF